MNPEKQNGTAPHGPAPETQPYHKASTANYIAGLRQRRAATYRLPVLDCGHVDPLMCRCQTRPLSTDSAVAAAEHLLHHGFAPLFGVEQARDLWRTGHRDYARHCVQQVAA